MRHSLLKLLYNTHSWEDKAPIHQQLVHETKRELMKASFKKDSEGHTRYKKHVKFFFVF